jgi:hypothetical protein
VFLYKDRAMDNVQKHNICTNVPSSQTLRSYNVEFKSHGTKSYQSKEFVRNVYMPPQYSDMISQDAITQYYLRVVRREHTHVSDLL